MPPILEAILGILTFGGPIGVYLDVRHWRKMGVPVNPGLVASIYTIGTLIVPWTLFFAIAASNLPASVNVFLSMLSYVPVAGLVWYVLVYRPKLISASRVSPGPLPPASTGSSLFFVFLLVLPILVIVGFVTFLSLVWR